MTGILVAVVLDVVSKLGLLDYMVVLFLGFFSLRFCKTTSRHKDKRDSFFLWIKSIR
jgi:hypothetical protein